MVHNGEDEICKYSGRSWIEVEADAEEDVPCDMVVDQRSTNAIDQEHHHIETQHHTACVSNADELSGRKRRDSRVRQDFKKPISHRHFGTYPRSNFGQAVVPILIGALVLGQRTESKHWILGGLGGAGRSPNNMNQSHVRGHRVFFNGLGELVQGEEEDGRGHHQNCAQSDKVDRDRNVGLGILSATEKGARADDAG